MPYRRLVEAGAVPAHVAQTMQWLATPGNAAIAQTFGLSLAAAPSSAAAAIVDHPTAPFTQPRVSLFNVASRRQLAALQAPSATEPTEDELLAAQHADRAIAL